METSAGLRDSDVRAENEALKQELERLHRELAQTSHEKIQSAQYGLVLLDEKQALQQRCDELEAMYDTTKHEMEILKEALAKVQTSQKVSTTTGIEQEESLLQETATKEASLTSSLQELEKELKQVRQELSRVLAEKERLQNENYEIMKHGDVSDWERKNLRSELKDMKLREQRLLTDNNELEEENISLQKQVSSLRSSQVEFEGAKHEVRRLKEEVESLNAQLEELGSLRRIGEQQLEEALEALQSEREQKYALRRELDQRLTAESPVFHLDGLSFAGFRLGSKRSLPHPLAHRSNVREPLASLRAGSRFNTVAGSGDQVPCTKAKCRSRGSVSSDSGFSSLRLGPRSLKLGKHNVASPAGLSYVPRCGARYSGSLVRAISPPLSRGVATRLATPACCQYGETVGASLSTIPDANSSMDSGFGSDRSPHCGHHALLHDCYCEAVSNEYAALRIHSCRESCRSAIREEANTPFYCQPCSSCPCDQHHCHTVNHVPHGRHDCKLQSGNLLCNTNGNSQVIDSYRGDSAGNAGGAADMYKDCTCEDALNSRSPNAGVQASLSKSISKKKAHSLSQIQGKRSDLGQYATISKASLQSASCPVNSFAKQTTASALEYTHNHEHSYEEAEDDTQIDNHSRSAKPSSELPGQFYHSPNYCAGTDDSSLAEKDRNEALQKQIFDGSWSSVSSISPIRQDSFLDTHWPCSASVEGSVVGDYLPHPMATRNGSITSSKSTKRHSWHCKGRKAVCKVSCAVVDYVFAP